MRILRMRPIFALIFLVLGTLVAYFVSQCGRAAAGRDQHANAILDFCAGSVYYFYAASGHLPRDPDEVTGVIGEHPGVPRIAYELITSGTNEFRLSREIGAGEILDITYRIAETGAVRQASTRRKGKGVTH